MPRRLIEPTSPCAARSVQCFSDACCDPGVEDAARQRAAKGDGALEGRHGQPRVDPAAEGVADDPPRPGVEDDRAVDEARQDGDIGYVGRPELIRGSWLKPGAAVIDVGQERVEQADGTRKLLGDVAFEEAMEVAGAITPVPGGVGPMTIACLLRNTMVAAHRREGLGEPEGL